MSTSSLWATMIFLGIMTFALRASFIIFWGDREAPQWLTRHLRYVAVAIIPGMIAGMLTYPPETADYHQAIWSLSALAALIAGVYRKDALSALLAGAGLYIILKAMQSFGILF